jgi:hypothetical protein
MLDSALFPRKFLIFGLLYYILYWTGSKSGSGMHYNLYGNEGPDKRNKVVQGRGDMGTCSNKSPQNAAKTTVPRYSKLL